MAEPAPRDRHAVCPRCYRPVTDKMPRVLTSGGSYHHRCYLRGLQPRREASEAAARRARGTGGAPPDDRLSRFLERLAQIVVIVIVIGTGLILLEYALP